MSKRTTRLSSLPVMLAVIALSLFSGSALADSDVHSDIVSAFDADEGVDAGTTSADESNSQSSESASIPRALSKLSVFGFLTQAWAEANYLDMPTIPLPDGSQIPIAASPTVDEQTLGIPEDGTTDYRFLALQFRYAISSKDTMVIQFSSRELGISPTELIEEDVKLDWAFYEHRFGDNTGIKIGKVQIPYGIFNEIRDVGTILPFYRPPFGYYSEGTFTSETLDGIVLNQSFFSSSDWNLTADIFFGEYDSVEVAVPLPGVPVEGPPVNVARNSDTIGYQIWLMSPYSDFRIGTGLLRRRLVGDTSLFIAPGTKSHFLPTWTFSVDAPFSRVVVRGELQTTTSPLDSPIGVIAVTFKNYYAQLGVRLTDKFWAWAQHDVKNTYNSADALSARLVNTYTDSAISLNFAFSPNIVLKAEYHETEADIPFLLPTGPPGPGFLQVIPFDVDGGSYSIVALSVAF